MLKRCLESVQAQRYKDKEIIVILNNPKAINVEEFKIRFKEINFIYNDKNEYLASSYNKGILSSKAEYVLCMNDDVILENNYCSVAVDRIARNDRIGMFIGKIMRFDHKTIDTTGLFLSGARTPLERGFGKKDNGQYGRAGVIFGVSGCCGMYKRSMLENIKDEFGYFDKRFKMFYEDLDLCWRANNNGYKAYYDPCAVAYHKRSLSASQRMPRLRFLQKYYFTHLTNQLQAQLIKNRVFTILKNDSILAFIKNFLFIFYYDLKLCLYICLLNPKLFIFIIFKT